MRECTSLSIAGKYTIFTVSETKLLSDSNHRIDVETSANMYLVLSLMHGMVLLDCLLAPFFSRLSVAFSQTSDVGGTELLMLLNL